MYYGNSFNGGRIRTGRAGLVAISIPIFTSQLEKSRDAVSVANIRAAYAEATSELLTWDGKATTFTNSNVTGITKDGTNTKVVVKDVAIKSQKNDSFSGEAAELPGGSSIADPGVAGDYNVTFTYDANGNCTGITMNKVPQTGNTGE